VSLPFAACGRDVLERAKRNLETFAAVGLTERIEQSVAVMKTRLGWPYVPTLYRKNENPARRNREALSSTELGAIVERNQLDLELYAFAEEMLQRQLASRHEAIRAL